ncbi:MAG TPA: outer membrane beta-barrel protein [Vicinamibacterales bacterium]|nr:outer membrane beta-barrel protein [Vicinamibacterales bacterium]
MRALRLMCVTALILAIDVRVAGAQSNPWTDKVRVSVNVGGQLSSTTFTSTAAPLIYLEPATITTSYTTPKGLLFDGGFLVRVAGNFGVGAGLSAYSAHHDAAVNGSIPHPFFFNTPRTLSGTAASLQRSEVTANIQAAYVLVSSHLDVVFAGGPSIFRVGQDLVSNVVLAETYPYDTVTFTSATTERAEKTKLGFNVGADVGYRLSHNVGVGGLVRYSRVSLSLPLAGSASGVSVDAGGLQVGGGVRFYF